MRTNIFKEKLFWVILISLLVGFIVYELFGKALTTFDNFLRLIQSIASFLTIGLAYLLFDKYGLKKNVIEKQLNAVTDILIALKKIRIHYDVSVYDNGTKTKYSSEFGRIFIEKDMSIYRKIRTTEKKDILIMVEPNDFSDGTKDLMERISSIWTPTSIRDKFSFLNVAFFNPLENGDKTNTINLAFKGGILKASPPTEFYLIYDGKLTFGQLIDSLENGILECQKWINDHAQHDFQLNI